MQYLSDCELLWDTLYLAPTDDLRYWVSIVSFQKKSFWQVRMHEDMLTDAIPMRSQAPTPTETLQRRHISVMVFVIADNSTVYVVEANS